MISFILEVIIAGLVSYLFYDWRWWASPILFSIIMLFGNQVYIRFMPKTNKRVILDFVIMISQIIFIAANIYIFQVNLGNWYGWLIGLVVGWILMTIWVPKRWEEEAKYNM